MRYEVESGVGVESSGESFEITSTIGNVGGSTRRVFLLAEAGDSTIFCSVGVVLAARRMEAISSAPLGSVTVSSLDGVSSPDRNEKGANESELLSSEGVFPSPVSDDGAGI